MISLIEKHRLDITKLCQEYRVNKLELFGSALTERFDPARSDLDFLVEFQDLEEAEYADAYFGLLLALQDLFARPIDLLMESAIRNPYLLDSIRKTRTLLYAA